MSKAQQEQSADISILDYPECVRKRKEMYLPNMSHAIFEIVDNGVDEICAGHGSVITVEIKQDHISVTDNGRGIPVTMHKDPRYSHLTQAEVAYTVLHAGGKFGGEGSYKSATGGLHGVGASVTNALSEKLTLEVCTGGSMYKAEFEKGEITDNMKKIGPIPEELGEDFTGTSVTFTLDPEIWKEEDLEIKRIQKRLQQIAFLNPGLAIQLDVDYTQKDGKAFDIHEMHKYDEGLVAYIQKLLNGKKQISPIIGYSTTVNDIQINFAVSYSDGYSEELYSFVNNISTEDGGEHLIGLRNGIARAINKYAVENKILKEGQKYDIGDCLEGSVGIVSIKVFEPKFDGQSKSKIKMPGVRQPVRETVENTFYEFLDANPEEAQMILKKAELAQKARQSAQRAREAIRKSKSLTDGNPKGYASCQSKVPEECEIWYAEGDSAGGSLKQGRDRKTQAILPVFGKIANVEKMGLDQVFENSKLLDIVKPLKCGIGEDFDLSKMRYHKCILASDADDDGKHIVTLYITFFYRYLRPIIEAGMLYISTPPLYKIEKGKKTYYAYSDADRDAILAEVGNGAKIQRYKGLGEMNPNQLWETTMNPETRKLLQVTIDDAEACNEAISICMGEEVGPRKKFIFDNAIYADLDL